MSRIFDVTKLKVTKKNSLAGKLVSFFYSEIWDLLRDSFGKLSKELKSPPSLLSLEGISLVLGFKGNL